MWLNRREFLTSTAVAGLVLPEAAHRQGTAANASTAFPYGVASGDPLSDRVVLWTRVAATTGTVDVRWRIAADPAFASIIASGSIRTAAARDFTVKVDAGGLEPGTP
jgi:alkaline phosphatase D